MRQTVASEVLRRAPRLVSIDTILLCEHLSCIGLNWVHWTCVYDNYCERWTSIPRELVSVAHTSVTYCGRWPSVGGRWMQMEERIIMRSSICHRETGGITSLAWWRPVNGWCCHVAVVCPSSVILVLILFISPSSISSPNLQIAFLIWFANANSNAHATFFGWCTCLSRGLEQIQIGLSGLAAQTTSIFRHFSN